MRRGRSSTPILIAASDRTLNYLLDQSYQAYANTPMHLSYLTNCYYRVLTLFLCFSLSACSRLSHSNEELTHDTTTQGNSGDSNYAQSVSEKAEIKYGNFKKETLYDLLLAETAFQRRDYQTAFTLYEKQAKLTKDSAVIAHAARLALSLRQTQQYAGLVSLWYEVEPENIDAQQGYLDYLIANHDFNKAWQMIITLDEQELRDPSSGVFADLAYTLVNVEEQTKADANLPARSHDHSALQKEIEANLKTREKDSDALLGLSFIAESEGDSESALKFAKRAYENDQDLVRAGYQIMRMQYALQNFAGVKKTLVRLVNDHPESVPLRESLARTYFDEKDYAKAAYHYKTLLLTKSQDPMVRFRLGIALIEDNKPEEARRQFEELIRQQQLVSRSYFQLATIAKNEKDYDRAYAYLDLLDDPALRTSVLNERVKLLMEQQRKPEALTEINAVLDAVKSDYRQKEQPSSALADDGSSQSSKKLELLERELESVVMLQADTLKNDSLASALDAVRQGTSMLPKSIALHYKEAMLYTEFDRMDDSIRVLEKAHSKFPDNPDIANALGYTLADENRELERAKQLVQMALESDPDSAAFLDSLGWVEYRLGNFDGAYTLLKKAFESFPDPEVGAHYAAALWKLDKKKQSRAVLQKIIKQADEGKDHKAIKQVIQDLNIDKI